MDALNKKRGKIYWFLRQYGHYILLGLILLSAVADYVPALRYFDVLSYIMLLMSLRCSFLYVVNCSIFLLRKGAEEIWDKQ